MVFSIPPLDSAPRTPATPRRKVLEAQASELVLADAKAVPLSVLQSWNIEQNDNFDDAEAIETTCALLKLKKVAETTVQSIESDATFWQLNWCHVHPLEMAAQVCKYDNSCPRMSAKDETGQLNL